MRLSQKLVVDLTDFAFGEFGFEKKIPVPGERMTQTIECVTTCGLKWNFTKALAESPF